MGIKWCYCDADILEKLMDENNCPLGNNYDIDKIGRLKRRTVSFRTDVDIFGNPIGKARDLKITYDES
jgi:hypothetical protein